ncbi:MAG: DinB family protein [Acidobacteriota bacterium]
MRGPLDGVDPLVQPLFFSFTMVREDLTLHTAGLSTGQVWRRVGPLPSLGFHLRHIAGSVDRLATYLMNEPISAEQLAYLKREAEPGASLEELLAGVDATLQATEERARSIDPATIHEPRYIGRKRLPTTVLGLLVHLAEHTQRHLGQAITTAKLARQTEVLAALPVPTD